MSIDRSIQEIPVVAEHCRRVGAATTTPVVRQEFHAEKGWAPAAWNKRVSRSYARKLRAEGITHVGLEILPGRIADFRIEELTR